MSVLVALGADITPPDLIDIAQELTLDELKSCFIGGVCSADNPIAAGMALSVAIETAVWILPGRQRRNLSDLQDKLDELLLEVLERLPQSINRMPRGVDGCVAIFEPETVGARGANYRGPLKLALQERQFTETVCVSPLVFEYLSYKFVSGLPMPWDSEDHIRTTYDRQRGSFSITEGMAAESYLGRLMQGLRTRRGSQGGLDRPRDWDKLLSSTMYPGTQFVVAGVITKPVVFYKVPAIRMSLDLIVHLFMLAVYTVVVLEDDDGTVSKTEIALTFHVMVSGCRDQCTFVSEILWRITNSRSKDEANHISTYTTRVVHPNVTHRYRCNYEASCCYLGHGSSTLRCMLRYVSRKRLEEGHIVETFGKSLKYSYPRSHTFDAHIARVVSPYCARSDVPYSRGLVGFCVRHSHSTHDHACRAFKGRTFGPSIRPCGAGGDRPSRFDQSGACVHCREL